MAMERGYYFQPIDYNEDVAGEILPRRARL